VAVLVILRITELLDMVELMFSTDIVVLAEEGTLDVSIALSAG